MYMDIYIYIYIYIYYIYICICIYIYMYMIYWKPPSYHFHTYPSVSCGCSTTMSKHSAIGPDSAEIAPRLDLPRGLWDTPLHMQTLPPHRNIILQTPLRGVPSRLLRSISGVTINRCARPHAMPPHVETMLWQHLSKPFKSVQNRSKIALK